MRVAVLGANGQLGSDLRAAIGRRANEFTLVAVARPELDAQDPDKARKLLDGLDFDAAINCVAATRVDDCETNAQSAVDLNACFAGVAAQACAAREAALLQVSTDYVFGGQTERRPLTEDQPRHPLNVYGATKLLGEDLARRAWPQTTIARVASLYGHAGASGKGGNFVETMLRLGAERSSLNVVADQWMSPTSTHDVADALLDILRAAPIGETYNVVNDGVASWAEFATEIMSTAGLRCEVKPITTAEYPTPAVRPPYSALDGSRLAELRGRPMPHWKDALRRYLSDRSAR